MNKLYSTSSLKMKLLKNGRIYFSVLFTLVVLFTFGQQMEAQNHHNLVDQTANITTDEDSFENEFKSITANANFVNRNAVISILTLNISELEQMISGGNLSDNDEKEASVSLKFRKKILQDLNNGSPVKNAFDDNINYFLLAYNQYEAYNIGVTPIDLFNKSVQLVSN